MSLFPRIVANDFAPMFRLVDDYASHIATRGWPAAHQSFNSHSRSFRPRFDIKENKDTYELQGELPGIAQKDLTIEFSDAQTISIRGRTQSLREEGTRPAAAAPAAIEGESTREYQPQAASEGNASETSSKYQKATVENEDDATASGTTPDAASTTSTIEGEGIATPATETASEAPQQQQQVASQQQQEQPAKVQGPKYWLSERSIGSFSRTFQFDHRVDVDAVKASLQNGILSIVVPKAAPPVSKTINVE